MSLPGAEELFRTTGGTALQPSSPRQHPGGEAGGPAGTERLRPVPAPAAGPDAAPAGQAPGEAPADADAAARDDGRPDAAEHARGNAAESSPARRQQPQERVVAQQQRGRRRGSQNRRPSGRERHDEKITVYVSAEELMDLEHARLVLRGEHGLAVDRGRIVREAVAVVLADLESRGDASILVRRLRGR
ncbi:hypothetical protein [Streptantibioticus cattleyicolor]|uniref:hypothetical protein n=1 Tax=Streptantibioticus cattleyicolor TaxID=29303 RepID=UPI003899D2C7